MLIKKAHLDCHPPPKGMDATITMVLCIDLEDLSLGTSK